MFKTCVLSIFFVLFSANLSVSQSILQSAFVTTGIVNLGDMGQVQISFSQITVCDSYTTTTTINHLAKIIDVKVDYIYVSTCQDAIGTITITENFLPLLEGIYTVNVNISVPADITRGEMRAIGSLTTNPPFYPDCARPFSNQQFCPVGSTEVCAENGKNYPNECESFFNERYANYTFGNCFAVANPNIQAFECNQIYTAGAENNFTSYNCFFTGCFDQNEAIIRYNHPVSGPLSLQYSKTALSEVLLTTFSASGVECIETGTDNLLEINNLAAGEYFIIVDSRNSFSIEFCTIPTSTNEQISDSDLILSPNPTSGKIKIEATNFISANFEIYGLTGKILERGKLPRSQELDISTAAPGTYFLRLKNEERSIVKKFILQ